MSQPDAESTPKVSVVVPVYNGAAKLPDLLRALDAQTVPPGTFEVLIADDGSTDNTAAIVNGWPGATLVPAPHRGGSYAARNRALTRSRGSLLAFTDGDCIPDANWIAEGLRRFELNDAEMIAGRIAIPLPPNPSIATLIDASRFLDQRRYVGENFGATANLWVRATVLEEVGPFNERVVSGGDTEFCHRAVAAGARLVYEPDLVVVHEPRRHAIDLWKKSYRLGFGAAQHTFHANGPLRDRDRVWQHPGAYLPKGRMLGLERLEEQGVNLSRMQRRAMFWMQYFCVKLPNAFGNLAGHMRELRNKRRGGPAEVARA